MAANVKDKTTKRTRKVTVKMTRGGREGCMITQSARDVNVLWIKLGSDVIPKTE
jgi:hypothetical protein